MRPYCSVLGPAFSSRPAQTGPAGLAGRALHAVLWITRLPCANLAGTARDASPAEGPGVQDLRVERATRNRRAHAGLESNPRFCARRSAYGPELRSLASSAGRRRLHQTGSADCCVPIPARDKPAGPRGRNRHISRASNSALALADAPWAAFLDHDDLLAPDACRWPVTRRNVGLRLLLQR